MSFRYWQFIVTWSILSTFESTESHRGRLASDVNARRADDTDKLRLCFLSTDGRFESQLTETENKIQKWFYTFRGVDNFKFS